MPEITPQEDLLHDSDIRTVTYRPELMPGWFKICLGLLLFYYIRELFSIPALFRQANEADEDTRIVLIVTYSIYLLSSVAMVVVRFMFHAQSDHTMKVAIPSMILSLLLGIIAIVGIYASGESMALSFLVVMHAIVLIAVMVHTFRIRKKWKDASRIS